MDTAAVILGAIAGLLIGGLIAAVYFALWRARYLGRIRADAVRQSRAVITGKVAEQLVPWLPAFPFHPGDARFLGSPVDLVVFDGLDAGALRRIVLVEIKTGRAGLTARERQVRTAVQEGRVEWLELRVGGAGS